MSAPALEGDLAHFVPSEVLQLVQLAQATGRLEFERGERAPEPGEPTGQPAPRRDVERVDLYVDRGRPVFARTTGFAVRVGEVLAHRGLVSAEVVSRALARQGVTPGRRLGALLVEAGAVSAEQVTGAVHEVLRRIVYGVLLWRAGRFRFVPGDAGIGEDIQIDLDLDRLILEGLRAADQERAGRHGEAD